MTMNKYQRTLSPLEIRRVIRLKRRVLWIYRHWLGITLILFFLFNIGAWSAPVLMDAGLTNEGNLVYSLYGPFCHQMAQRSFFLFGDKMMYTPAEMGTSISNNTTVDTWAMRRFRGSPEVGWKVAWSDRMVYMYGSLWLVMFIFYILAQYRQVKPLAIGWLVVLILPMMLDGVTHFISDLGGMFAGFRYTNYWLATLIGYSLPSNFYKGDALGSFNSWMRLASSLTFGLGIGWFLLPRLIAVTQFNVVVLEKQLAHFSPIDNR